MGEFLKKTLLLVLRTPLVAGNPTSEAACRRDTDGSTSVTVLVAVTFPMTIVLFFMLTWYKGDSETLYNLHWASRAPFMSIAVISLTGFFVVVLKNKKILDERQLRMEAKSICCHPVGIFMDIRNSNDLPKLFKNHRHGRMHYKCS